MWVFWIPLKFGRFLHHDKCSEFFCLSLENRSDKAFLILECGRCHGEEKDASLLGVTHQKSDTPQQSNSEEIYSGYLTISSLNLNFLFDGGVLKEGSAEGRAERSAEGRAKGRKEGRKEGRMDGWMDGWKDGMKEG